MEKKSQTEERNNIMNYFSWLYIFSIVWFLWAIPSFVYFRYRHNSLIKNNMKKCYLFYIFSYVVSLVISIILYLLLLNGLKEQQFNNLSPAVPVLLMFVTVILTFMISYYSYLQFSKKFEEHSINKLFFYYTLLLTSLTCLYGIIFLVFFG